MGCDADAVERAEQLTVDQHIEAGAEVGSVESAGDHRRSAEAQSVELERIDVLTRLHEQSAARAFDLHRFERLSVQLKVRLRRVCAHTYGRTHSHMSNAACMPGGRGGGWLPGEKHLSPTAGSDATVREVY